MVGFGHLWVGFEEAGISLGLLLIGCLSGLKPESESRW